jgi:hypothetical protein
VAKVFAYFLTPKSRGPSAKRYSCLRLAKAELSGPRPKARILAIRTATADLIDSLHCCVWHKK